MIHELLLKLYDNKSFLTLFLDSVIVFSNLIGDSGEILWVEYVKSCFKFATLSKFDNFNHVYLLE